MVYQANSVIDKLFGKNFADFKPEDFARAKVTDFDSRNTGSKIEKQIVAETRNKTIDEKFDLIQKEIAKGKDGRFDMKDIPSDEMPQYFKATELTTDVDMAKDVTELFRNLKNQLNTNNPSELLKSPLFTTSRDGEAAVRADQLNRLLFVLANASVPGGSARTPEGSVRDGARSLIKLAMKKAELIREVSFQDSDTKQIRNLAYGATGDDLASIDKAFRKFKLIDTYNFRAEGAAASEFFGDVLASYPGSFGRVMQDRLKRNVDYVLLNPINEEDFQNGRDFKALKMSAFKINKEISKGFEIEINKQINELKNNPNKGIEEQFKLNELEDIRDLVKNAFLGDSQGKRNDTKAINAARELATRFMGEAIDNDKKQRVEDDQNSILRSLDNALQSNIKQAVLVDSKFLTDEIKIKHAESLWNEYRFLIKDLQTEKTRTVIAKKTPDKVADEDKVKYLKHVLRTEVETFEFNSGLGRQSITFEEELNDLVANSKLDDASQDTNKTQKLQAALKSIDPVEVLNEFGSEERVTASAFSDDALKAYLDGNVLSETSDREKYTVDRDKDITQTQVLSKLREMLAENKTEYQFSRFKTTYDTSAGGGKVDYSKPAPDFFGKGVKFDSKRLSSSGWSKLRDTSKEPLALTKDKLEKLVSDPDTDKQEFYEVQRHVRELIAQERQDAKADKLSTGLSIVRRVHENLIRGMGLKTDSNPFQELSKIVRSKSGDRYNQLVGNNGIDGLLDVALDDAPDYELHLSKDDEDTVLVKNLRESIDTKASELVDKYENEAPIKRDIMFDIMNDIKLTKPAIAMSVMMKVKSLALGLKSGKPNPASAEKLFKPFLKKKAASMKKKLERKQLAMFRSLNATLPNQVKELIDNDRTAKKAAEIVDNMFGEDVNQVKRNENFNNLKTVLSNLSGIDGSEVADYDSEQETYEYLSKTSGKSDPRFEKELLRARKIQAIYILLSESLKNDDVASKVKTTNLGGGDLGKTIKDIAGDNSYVFSSTGAQEKFNKFSSLVEAFDDQANSDEMEQTKKDKRILTSKRELYGNTSHELSQEMATYAGLLSKGVGDFFKQFSVNKTMEADKIYKPAITTIDDMQMKESPDMRGLIFSSLYNTFKERESVNKRKDDKGNSVTEKSEAQEA